MRREAWRWAARETERQVDEGRGKRRVKESGERKRRVQRAYIREKEGWRPKMIGILGE